MLLSNRALCAYGYSEPCDMRKSFNTLSALVTNEMGHQIEKGDLFVFVSRDGKRAKVLYFDGTGLCLWSKRMDKGRFVRFWKRKQSAQLELSISELALFIEGSDWVGRHELSPPVLREHDLRIKSVAR